MSRPFVFTNAYTIMIGANIIYVAGFHTWANQTVSSTTVAAALGDSPILYWTITDMSTALQTSIFALTILTIAF